MAKVTLSFRRERVSASTGGAPPGACVADQRGSRLRQDGLEPSRIDQIG